MATLRDLTPEQLSFYAKHCEYSTALDGLREMTLEEKCAALEAEPVLAHHKGITYKRYDSLTEFMGARPVMAENMVTMHASFDHADDADHSRTDWFGLPTADAAVSAMRHGWPEGAQRLRDTVDRLTPQFNVNVACVKRQRVRGDQGDSYDVHRAYSGGLDKAWQTTRRRHKTAVRAVTIVAQSSMLSPVKSSVLFWRGAAALMLVEALEQAGYSTELHLASRCTAYISKTPNHRRVACVKVKDADTPTDIERLAAGMCLGAMHRIGMFRDRGSLPRKLSSSMGSSEDLDAADLAALDLPPDTVIVPRGDLCDEASALRWLRETLDRLAA